MHIFLKTAAPANYLGINLLFFGFLNEDYNLVHDGIEAGIIWTC